MTDIEIVAKLLGWEPAPEATDKIEGYRYYRLKDDHRIVCGVRPDGATDGVWFAWPDPDDYNTIRRVEDALAGRGLLGTYTKKLDEIVEVPPDYDQRLSRREWRLLRATASQRIKAAAQVLREGE